VYKISSDISNMTSIRLTKKAYATLNALECSMYKKRVIAFDNINEHEFSLLLLWIRIEMQLKILRYHKKIQQWPDRLDFIKKSWRTLKDLDCDLPNEYEMILGNNERSLWKKRDKIVHMGLKMEAKEAVQYKKAAESIIRKLETISPNKEALLRKKRNSDAQIRRGSK